MSNLGATTDLNRAALASPPALSSSQHGERAAVLAGERGPTEETPPWPLIVDLDGTLTPTDTLYESLVVLIRARPLDLFAVLPALARGRAAFKAAVADRALPDMHTIPWHSGLLKFIRDQQVAGRTIVLATAADRRIADLAAAHLGLFDDVIASSDGRNLKGSAKLAAIRRSYPGDFTYVGNSTDDVAVWKGAKAAIAVNASTQLANYVKANHEIERTFEEKPAKPWLRALRVHQWIKNLLLFLPLLTSLSSISPAVLGKLVVAFLAFSIAASATYLANDLHDLPADRRHPRKQTRPFASGAIGIVEGCIAIVLLMAVAVLAAAWVSPQFLAALLGYVLFTTTYSWMLKGYVMVDVMALSLLYTWRILAGSAVLQMPVSNWMLAFSAFSFLSLALVKRCAELVAARSGGQVATAGRDYRTSDLSVLMPLGAASAMASIVVLCLFIESAETQSRYVSPSGLWLVAYGLVYWYSRLWIKTSRGEMHDDPVVYTLRDRASAIVFLTMIAVVVACRFISFERLS